MLYRREPSTLRYHLLAMRGVGQSLRFEHTHYVYANPKGRMCDADGQTQALWNFGIKEPIRREKFFGSTSGECRNELRWIKIERKFANVIPLLWCCAPPHECHQHCQTHRFRLGAHSRVECHRMPLANRNATIENKYARKITHAWLWIYSRGISLMWITFLIIFRIPSFYERFFPCRSRVLHCNRVRHVSFRRFFIVNVFVTHSCHFIRWHK